MLINFLLAWPSTQRTHPLNESQLIAMLLRNADWPVGLHLSSLTVPLKLFRRSRRAGNDDLKVKYGVETTYVSYFDSNRESDPCFLQLSLGQKNV